MTVELATLAELEPALARESFDVARVFVGYAACAPTAPGPCELPAVAYTLEAPRAPTGTFATGEWHMTWSPREYAAAIETVRAAIYEGDVYQVNLVQHLQAGFSGDPLAVAAALAPLRPLEPAPLQGEGWTIVSASPELLLQKRGNVVRTSPIKGTRPAGVSIESAKDAAEHVMIVDLERNDLSRVCVPGSVRWPELLVERALAGVTHLVATVEGELRPGVTLTELLEALDKHSAYIRRQGGDFANYVEKRDGEFPSHLVKVREGNEETAGPAVTMTALQKFGKAVTPAGVPNLASISAAVITVLISHHNNTFL